MMTKTFWKQAFERAIKTFAQCVLLNIGASRGFNLFASDLWNLLGFGLGGMVLSLLTSIVSVPVGAPDSPSLVQITSEPK